MSFVQAVPDVAQEKLKFGLPIDLVGIRDLKLPVSLSRSVKNLANVSLFVSLEDKKTRGIHMSRLYTCLHKAFATQPVSLAVLKKVLIQAIKSQKGHSKSGRICIKSSWPVLQKALKSQLKGWRDYPFYFEVDYLESKKAFQYVVGGELLYSSTCPCSASLSREIIKQDFEKQFSSSSILKKDLIKYLDKGTFLSATPHAQKSKAFFKLKLSETSKNSFSLLKIIKAIEGSLATAVQTAVKRQDEAEFARLNAQNMMFCEDAVRRIGFLFKTYSGVLDYTIRVQHYESLHPFTVESSLAKGLKKGWRV